MLNSGAPKEVEVVYSEIWTTYIEIGCKAFESGRYETAERMLRAAVKEVPKEMSSPGAVARIAENLGDVFLKQNRLPKAEKVFKRALQKYADVYGKLNRHCVRINYKLTALYVQQGRIDLANSWNRRSFLYAQSVRTLTDSEHCQCIMSTMQSFNMVGCEPELLSAQWRLINKLQACELVEELIG